MTRSQSRSASNEVVPDKLPSVVSRASAVTFPFVTPSSRNFLRRPTPFSRICPFPSRPFVLYPAAAQPSAIPDPIKPQPSTPTVRICIPVLFLLLVAGRWVLPPSDQPPATSH